MNNSASSPRAKLIIATQAKMRSAQYALTFANFSLRGSSFVDAGYADKVDIVDACFLKIARAKWLYWRSTGDSAEFAVHTQSDEDLHDATALFDEAISYCDKMREATGEEFDALAAWARAEKDLIHTKDSSVLYYHETPLVPSICPIVVLRGDSVSMGRQYVKQIADMFGVLAFDTMAKRVYSDAQLTVIGKWEEQLQRHAPEIIDMVEGMVEGAAAIGIPLTRHHAISMWSGDAPPVEKPLELCVPESEGSALTGYFGSVMEGAADGENLSLTNEMCSGFAAWGNATAIDGAVIGCTTDHDCTFQATIVAYPDTGRPFIYTPFSINASIPSIGRFCFAGHPGVNDAGVAYVHHGGPAGCVEPEESWGYGIKRGPSTFHALRFAGTQQEAKDYMLSLPIGDDGYPLGSPGGFYCDYDGGHIIESRTGTEKSDGPIVREWTYDQGGEGHDYLYANNNIVSPDCEGLYYPPEDGGYDFDLATGWRTLDTKKIFSGGGLGEINRHLLCASSEPRSRYFSRVLSERDGRMDDTFAEDVYRNGPNLDVNDWDGVEARLNAGEKLDGSTGTRTNAFVSVIKIERDEAPVYRACIGPLAHRSVSPHRATHGFYYYDETNALWEIALEPSAEEMLTRAVELASSLVKEAAGALGDVQIDPTGKQRLNDFLHDAQTSLAAAQGEVDGKAKGSDDDISADLSKRLTAATRAQVRAQQVLDGINPPVPDIPAASA